MPKILCTCGKALSFSEIPCPIEWRILSDVKFDQFQGQVDAQAIYLATDMMLQCPKCERLWVFWDEAQIATEYVKVTPSNKGGDGDPG